MLRAISKCHLIYARSLLQRNEYKMAISMFKKTINVLTPLLSILSNKSLSSVYQHSPNIKIRDVLFMLQLVYVNLAFCYQATGKLEHTLYSISEANFIASSFLTDSPESLEMIGKLNWCFNSAVASGD